MLEAMPDSLANSIRAAGRVSAITEIILDLDRKPEVRYFSEPRWQDLDDQPPVTAELIKQVAGKLNFRSNHRAAMPGTLHRIHANYDLDDDGINGLTCRVGRVINGAAEFVRETIETGQSILVLGPAGVGKTTLLRDMARILSESRIVVIVDKSLEIGGDSSAPVGVGRARRIKVKNPANQQPEMVEAVQNMTPETIFIDEIGNLDEVKASRTIAENGVQLIGTAHGGTLENLVRNVTLVDLIGGTHSPFIGDESRRAMAKKAGVDPTTLSKTKEERQHKPTFDILMVVNSRNMVTIYSPAERAIDQYLDSGTLPEGTVITRGENGQPVVSSSAAPTVAAPARANAAPAVTAVPIRQAAPITVAAQPGLPNPLPVLLVNLNETKVRARMQAVGLPENSIRFVQSAADAAVVLADRRAVSLHQRGRQQNPLLHAAENAASKPEVVGVRVTSIPQLEQKLKELGARMTPAAGVGLA